MQIKTVNPNFFIVRINKEEQREKRAGKGAIKNADTFIFGRAGMQQGEIIAIGKLAKMVMPFVKIGGTLLFSWKVEFNGEDNTKPNMALVNEDAEYRYYTISISEYKGRDSETYAYFDERCFYTHPSYIVLEKSEIPRDELTLRESGIVVYKNYQFRETDITDKIAFNTQWIYSLSITYACQSQLRESDARQTKEMIKNIEAENMQLTQMLQGKEMFESYTVVYSNPLHEAQTGDNCYAENIFFLEPIKIHGNTYFIGKFKHVAMCMPVEECLVNDRNVVLV